MTLHRVSKGPKRVLDFGRRQKLSFRSHFFCHQFTFTPSPKNSLEQTAYSKQIQIHFHFLFKISRFWSIWHKIWTLDLNLATLSFMWANLFNWIQQKWWKNLQNFELGTCQLFPWCCPPWSKLRNLAPWVLPWIPPWPLPYHGFSHRSHKLWVPWVLPWNPQLFSLSNWF